MKIQIILSLALIPFMAISQRNASLELSAGPNFTGYTSNVLKGVGGRFNYDFGISAAMPMKNMNREWLVGMRFSAYGNQYLYSALTWPSQHNGNGGIDPNSPLVEQVSYSGQSSYYYMEFPMSLRQNLKAGIARLFVQASAGPSYFLKGRNENTTIFDDGTFSNAISSENVDNFRKVNLFAGLSLGLEYPLGQKFSFQMLSHVQSQVLSIVEDTNNNSKWYAFGIRAGLRYQL